LRPDTLLFREFCPKTAVLAPRSATSAIVERSGSASAWVPDLQTLVMRYFALACDCDGTIASHGRVDGGTRSAIERLRASGRKLILVTGRELDDFMRVFPHVHLFNRIVAANCAAGTNQGFATCSRWRRRRRWVRAGAGAPRRHALSVGRVIVAHDAITLQCAGIRRAHSGWEERSARCETIDLPREGTKRNEASCPAEQGSDRLVERATTASAGRRGCSGPMSRRSRRAIANTRAMFEGKGWT
jgi:hypothetical protein